MEFIITVLTFIFIAMLIAAVIALGFWLMIAFIGVFVLFYVSLWVRRYWRRWWFLHHAASQIPPEKPFEPMIETEKSHITDIEYF